MDEQMLAAALASQDPKAVQELVSLYGDRLLRSAFLLSGNETEAEDLVQETFLQAVRSIHRFRGCSSLYTWLHAILLNLTRHYHRNRKRLVYQENAVALEPANAIQDASPLGLDLETSSDSLEAALRRLSAPHREVVVLRFYEDLKIHEIARQLGISKGTVKSRLHYALGQLQKLVPKDMNLFGDNDTKRIETR